MKTVKELKELILTKISEDDLNEKYTEMCKTRKIFEKNKQLAYHVIATELKIPTITRISRNTQGLFTIPIGEINTTDKTIYNVEGYVLRKPNLFTTKSGTQMAFITIADKTGIVSISMFSDGYEKADGVKVGDYVKLGNLSHKNKEYGPSFGKYSSLESLDAPYDISEIYTHKVVDIKDGAMYFVKGIVGQLVDVIDIYHCEKGHTLAGASDRDIGSLIQCEKCNNTVTVQKHKVGTFILSDETGNIDASFSVFAGIEDIEQFDDYIFGGMLKDEVFDIRTAIKLKKKV